MARTFFIVPPLPRQLDEDLLEREAAPLELEDLETWHGPVEDSLPRLKRRPAAGGIDYLGREDLGRLRAEGGDAADARDAREPALVEAARDGLEAQPDPLLALEGLADLGGRAWAAIRALVQDDDVRADGLDLLEDMGREDDRLALAQGADELADLDDLVGVETRRGLVEDEDGRVVEDGLGEPEALPVALGQSSTFLR